MSRQFIAQDAWKPIHLTVEGSRDRILFRWISGGYINFRKTVFRFTGKGVICFFLQTMEGHSLSSNPLRAFAISPNQYHWRISCSPKNTRLWGEIPCYAIIEPYLTVPFWLIYFISVFFRMVTTRSRLELTWAATRWAIATTRIVSTIRGANTDGSSL